MASNSELQMRNTSSGLGSFSNLLGKENHRWWGTRFWLIQFIIWLVIINGIIAMIYRTPVDDMVGSGSEGTSQAGQVMVQKMKDNPELVGLIPFMRLAGLGMVLGVVVVSQSAIISEKQSGTAAWVLSKPVPRSTFILSKVAGYGLGILGVMCVLIGAVLYGQIWLTTGVLIPPLSFVGMFSLVFLDLFFYLTLSIMLGSIFNSRGAVVGLPLILLFSYMIFPNIPTWLMGIMPWNLMDNLHQQAIALSVVQGQPVHSIIPVVASILWCLFFIGISLLRFRREEF